MTTVAPADVSARSRGEGGVAPPFSAWERGLAARYLRTTRRNGGVTLISWIAFGGIALSVAVLIIVMSVMNGFRTDLLSRILGFSGHVFIQGPAIQGPGREALIARLRATPGVVQVTPVVEATSLATGPSSRSGVVVRGVDPAELTPASLVARGIKEGSLRGFGQGEYGGDRVLIGSGVADTIGAHTGDPVDLISPDGEATVLGASTPREKTYQVGGVFSVGASNFDGGYIYMPLAQAQLFFGRGSDIDFMELKVADPDHVDRYLPAIRRAAGPGGVVTDWRDRSRSFWNALQTERSVMRLILMMIVGIAVLNIISGLIMLVKNKTRDIAILRTMGAGQGAVLRVFFMAGAAIGVSGALAGLVLGALFAAFIDQIQAGLELIGLHVWSADTYYLSRIPARIEWSEVATVMAWSLFMSFVATLPPAWRASRLDPVEALRYE